MRLATICAVLSFTTPAFGQYLTPELIGLQGQTCRGNTGMFDVVYSIDSKDGQWVVHDLFGLKGTPESAMKDVGWLLASLSGVPSNMAYRSKADDVAYPIFNTLSFQGMSALITLTATGEHTVAGHFSQTKVGRSGVFDYTLTCTPTPPEQRWRR
jgi:hypothetical protein